jgi:hypothetical protein
MLVWRKLKETDDETLQPSWILDLASNGENGVILSQEDAVNALYEMSHFYIHNGDFIYTKNIFL